MTLIFLNLLPGGMLLFVLYLLSDRSNSRPPDPQCYERKRQKEREDLRIKSGGLRSRRR